MKNKKISLLSLLCAGILLLSGCGNGNSRNPRSLTGADRDNHGCIPSAGYTWSEVRKDCIRLWEEGVRTENPTDSTQVTYLVFSPDSLQVELFFSDDRPNEILHRRPLPAGGHAWNVEDDDTKNVRLQDGIWTVSRRGKLLYRQTEGHQ